MTNDLISRKKALEIIKANHYPLRAEHNTVDYGMFTVGIEQAINDAPAVNAVEVVFCKNCIYQKDAKVNCKGFIICPASNMEITDDDYCSYGERRESEVG